MCRVFSCIIDRAGKVYSQKDDPSHTTIAKENNLPEDGVSELNRAKIEVVPQLGFSHRYEPTFDSWEVEVDESSIPEWINDRHYRSAMAAANKWWHSRVIKHGETRVVREGMWMVFEGSPEIVARGHAIVRVYNKSTPTITAYGEAKVLVFDNSAPKIAASASAQVEARQSSHPHITLHEDAWVGIYSDSSPTIKARDNSVVSISGHNGAKVEATSEVCFYGSKYNRERTSITII